MYREERDKFLSHFASLEAFNPELLRKEKEVFLFLIENANMNDDNEIKELLKTLEIENLSVIVLFDEGRLNKPVYNKLVYQLVRSMPHRLRAYTYVSQLDRYMVVKVIVSVENYIVLLKADS